MKPGDHAQVSRSFSKADLQDYAALSGHDVTDDRLPEPLIGAMFSYLLGIKVPGMGTMYLKQETRFLKPVPVNEQLTARVEITRVRPKKFLVDLHTSCCLASGEVIADGRALVYVRDVLSKGEKDDPLPG